MVTSTPLAPEEQHAQSVKLLVARESLIVTYDPETSLLSIDPLGIRSVGHFIRNFDVIADEHTGATVFILDRTFHTYESIGSLGTFSFSATSHTKSAASDIDGPRNVAAFTRWLKDRDDSISWQKMLYFFPWVFSPPAPVPEPEKKPWWRRR